MSASAMLVKLRAALDEATRMAEMALPEGSTLEGSAQPHLKPITEDAAAVWRQGRQADLDLARAVYEQALAEEARGVAAQAKHDAARSAVDRLRARSLPGSASDGSQIPG